MTPVLFLKVNGDNWPLMEVLKEGLIRQGNFDYLKALEEEADLHLRKAAGYSGHSPDVWINFRSVESIGLTMEQGILVRLMDKFERLKSLLQNPDNDQVGEPIDDLLLDISAYARIMRVGRKKPAAPGTAEWLREHPHG